MKYPMMNNFLTFKRIDSDTYEVSDYLSEKCWEIDKYLVCFLRKLNGKRNPYTIDREQDKDSVDKILFLFKKEGLIRQKRFSWNGFGSCLYTVCIPRIRNIHRYLAKLLNRFLMILYIPSIMLGIFVFVNHLYGNTAGSFCILKGTLLGMISGLILHELAHANACIAYGGRVFEFGVMLYWLLPGAYVYIDYCEVKNRFKRIQINAAGLEMNLLLSGLFMCMSCSGRLDSFLLIQASVVNLVFAIINISLIMGIDGMNICSEILGVENFAVHALELLMDRREKRRLRRKGINGRAVIAASYIIAIFQLLLPLIFIINVIELVRIIF